MATSSEGKQSDATSCAGDRQADHFAVSSLVTSNSSRSAAQSAPDSFLELVLLSQMLARSLFFSDTPLPVSLYSQ
jgi:hypothetical protein